MKRYAAKMIDWEQLKDIVTIMGSSGKSRQIDDFPLLQKYFEDTSEYPFMIEYDQVQLNPKSLIEFLDKYEIIYRKSSFDSRRLEVGLEHAVYKLSKGYFFEMSIGYDSIDEYPMTARELLKAISKKDNLAMYCTGTFLTPNEKSTLKDDAFEKEFSDALLSFVMPKNILTPRVGMICVEDNDYYVKDFFIKKDYTISDGDLHYGEGFTKFHESLLGRFKVDNKGLVLFHGEPGTGKTYYIRSLIKDLLEMGKYIIYLPPNMVDHMVSPEMMTFLSATVLEKAEEGKTCVLLLEDAEPLLISRKDDNRTNGITNLLNVTDGLLNDMLNVQVIATFNTELRNIDEALLRPERLIARKEFKKLRKEDAMKLAEKLNSSKIIEKDSTLAEIYSQSYTREILVHEYNLVDKKIGF